MKYFSYEDRGVFIDSTLRDGERAIALTDILKEVGEYLVAHEILNARSESEQIDFINTATDILNHYCTGDVAFEWDDGELILKSVEYELDEYDEEVFGGKG